MTTATRLRTIWNNTVDKYGNTVTIYDPTLTNNTEGDVSAYTLGTGTSITVIYLEDPDGTTWSSEVEGIDNRLTLRVLLKTTQDIDNESIIKIGSDYFTVAQGSLRNVTTDDTVIAKRAVMVKMLPQEALKIA